MKLANLSLNRDVPLRYLAVQSMLGNRVNMFVSVCALFSPFIRNQNTYCSFCTLWEYVYVFKAKRGVSVKHIPKVAITLLRGFRTHDTPSSLIRFFHMRLVEKQLNRNFASPRVGPTRHSNVTLSRAPVNESFVLTSLAFFWKILPLFNTFQYWKGWNIQQNI